MNAAAWSPGLDNGDRLLGDVYQSMPKDPADAVPWVVRALENPASALAFPGAVDLFGHDCIHAVLGRGLLAQDEAFVLGFTMGASQRCARWQRSLFRFCARAFYRGAYRFSDVDAEVFDFGAFVGRHAGTARLHEVDYRALLGRPLADVRRALRVNVYLLKAAYETESARWPHGPASERLRSGVCLPGVCLPGASVSLPFVPGEIPSAGQ